MRRLPRRLALWGGAAAIAAGGFAFMASGATDSSSASEGVGGVTGYTASAIHYTLGGTTNTCVNTNDGGAQESYLCALTFTLTSEATTTPANGVPAHVEAYLEKSTSAQKEITGTTSFTSCTATSAWTIGTTGAGTGTYSCTFKAIGEFHIATIGNVDIEANQ